jgi:hypothetical protein
MSKVLLLLVLLAAILAVANAQWGYGFNPWYAFITMNFKNAFRFGRGFGGYGWNRGFNRWGGFGSPFGWGWGKK